jgi:hypothetical protein
MNLGDRAGYIAITAEHHRRVDENAALPGPSASVGRCLAIVRLGVALGAQHADHSRHGEAGYGEAKGDNAIDARSGAAE